MYSVSEVAEIFQVSSSTIRSWSIKGILKPSWTSPTGRKYYDADSVMKLYREGLPDGSSKS